MYEDEVLEIIHSGGDTAYGLLYDADPKLISKFKRVDKAIIKLLDEVKEHFPDAEYYTASGGFNLLLGNSHDLSKINSNGRPELVACVGNAFISDGDF